MAFRAFLADYIESLSNDALQRWLAQDSNYSLAEDHERRWRIVQVREMLELQFGDMLNFYQGTEHATQTDQA